MNIQNKIIALMNKRIVRMRKESCHPLMAIVVAALEAGILEGGLVEPLHMSQRGSAGTVMRSTMQQAIVSFAERNDCGDFQFPLHIVVTDELGNGELELDIETGRVAVDLPHSGILERIGRGGTHRVHWTI
jgi:hypothetical protein